MNIKCKIFSDVFLKSSFMKSHALIIKESEKTWPLALTYFMIFFLPFLSHFQTLCYIQSSVSFINFLYEFNPSPAPLFLTLIWLIFIFIPGWSLMLSLLFNSPTSHIYNQLPNLADFPFIFSTSFAITHLDSSHYLALGAL